MQKSSITEIINKVTNPSYILLQMLKQKHQKYDIFKQWDQQNIYPLNYQISEFKTISKINKNKLWHKFCTNLSKERLFVLNYTIRIVLYYSFISRIMSNSTWVVLISTRINITVTLRKQSLFIVLLRTLTQEQPIRRLWETAPEPLYWRHLNYCLYSSRYVQERVAFTNTPNKVAWIHLVSVLKYHAIHIPMPCM